MSGHGGLVVVEGDAGIGKSRLIDEFAACASAAGACVVRGSCLPFALALPYAPIIEVLGQLTAAVPSAGAPDAADRNRFFQWVTDQLTDEANRQPLVVVVEDLHWVDDSTGDLLLFLVLAIVAIPLLLVGSRRSDEPDGSRPFATALGELFRSGRAEQVRLPPLDRNQVTQLLGGILGIGPSSGLVDRVVSRAEGNPYFTEELVAAGGGDDLPSTVKEVVLARVARVEPETQALLRVAAATGRRVGDRLLCDVARLDRPHLDMALRDAVGHRLLVGAADGYAFRHALAHEAVYGELLPGERQALHERIAQALAAHPELAVDNDPAVAAAELAHHWHAANRPAEAIAASVAAGQAAEASYAPSEATAQYQRALDLWPKVPDAARRTAVDRTWLLSRAAETASFAGKLDVAVELTSELLAGLDADHDPEPYASALEHQIRYLWNAGQRDAAREMADTLARHIPAGPSSSRASALCALATNALVTGQMLRAIEAAKDATDAAAAVDDHLHGSYAMLLIGTAQNWLGCHEEGLGRIHTALTWAQETGDNHRIATTWHNLVDAYIIAGRPAEALPLARAATDELRRRGLVRTFVPAVASLQTRAHFALGQWDEADQASAHAMSNDSEVVFALPLQLSRAPLLMRRGRFDDAAEMLAVIDDTVSRSDDPEEVGLLACCQAEFALWQADWDAARRAVQRGYQTIEGTDELPLAMDLFALATRVEVEAFLAARLDALPANRDAARDAARRHIAEARAWLGRIENETGCCSLPFHLTHDLARAEYSRLDDPPPAEPWAAVATRAGHDVYLRAYAQWHQAEALLATRSAGDKANATTVLRAAHAAADDLRAETLLRELRDLARRARIDLTATEPARADKPEELDALTRHGLTTREREVLHLLAQGLSNGEIGEALFISGKTASVHVTHILQKLTVTSRLQAAAIAHRLEREQSS